MLLRNRLWYPWACLLCKAAFQRMLIMAFAYSQATGSTSTEKGQQKEGSRPSGREAGHLKLSDCKVLLRRDMLHVGVASASHRPVVMRRWAFHRRFFGYSANTTIQCCVLLLCFVPFTVVCVATRARRKRTVYHGCFVSKKFWVRDWSEVGGSVNFTRRCPFCDWIRHSDPSRWKERHLLH